MTNERQKAKLNAILDLLPEVFTQPQLAKLAKVSTRTAQRKIKEAIHFKLIQVDRRQGNTIFYQKINFRFSSYQQKFLDEYVPGRTFFLSKKERSLLKDSGSIHASVDLETLTAHIYQRLMIDISWASSHLEGNTYSLLETEKLLLENQVAEGKNLIETQMILNHKEAIQFLILNRATLKMDQRTILSIHALLSENILSHRSAMGALRKIPVGISGTAYSPLQIPQQIEEEFSVFLQKSQSIPDPFEQALFILIFIPYIQPFEDINKRTSRIACNIPFIQKKMVPISFKNVDRDRYIQSLLLIYEHNDIAAMKELFIESYLSSTKEYLNLKSTMVTPSPALIQYRQQIKKIVYDCVSRQCPLKGDMLDQIPKEFQKEVFNHIQLELRDLHEGSLVRFGLTPKQFRTWKLKLT